MDYNHITKFLEKFKQLIFQKEELKNIVIKTIENEVHCKVESSTIKIKNGVVYLKGSPMLRSEIMMHKKQIIETLGKILPESKFLDIK